MGNFNRNDNYRSRDNYSRSGSSDRQIFQAVCSNCGRDCDLPFKPTGSRPVFCRDCFAKNGPQDQGRGREQSRGARRDDSDRPMFEAVCANCGDHCMLPFQPRPGKEALCSKCFEEKGGDPRRINNHQQNSSQIDAINAKLDRILELLSPTSEKKALKKEKKAEIKAEEIVVPEIIEMPEETAEIVVETTTTQSENISEKPAKKAKKKSSKAN